MLFNTSLVAIVGSGEKMNSSQRKLSIANTKVSNITTINYYYFF